MERIRLFLTIWTMFFLSGSTNILKAEGDTVDDKQKAIDSVKKKEDMNKITKGASHGYAFLERIRNMTDFSVSIFYKKTIHDALPVDTTVRIKSFKPEYGEDGRYYAARLVGGAWRLQADTTDKNDTATLFNIHRYVSRDLRDWLAFSSAAGGKKYLNSKPSQSTQFGAPDYADDIQTAAHWEIVGASTDRCALRNRETGGFLSCRGKEDETKLGEYTPPPNNFEWEAISKKVVKEKYNFGEAAAYKREVYTVVSETRSKNNMLPLGNTGDHHSLAWKSANLGTQQAVHVKRWGQPFGIGPFYDNQGRDQTRTVNFAKNSYALHELMAFIDMTRHHIVAGADANVGIQTIQRFSDPANRELSKFKALKKEVHYGDKVRIVHGDTWQTLAGTSDEVFAGNNHSPNEHKNEKDFWYVIKGPHKKGDAFNCNIGDLVENGDVIRLEHATTRKNLNCSKQKPNNASIRFGSAPDSGPEYKVILNGKDGVGSSSDNWIVNFETDAMSLSEGATFYLTSRNTGFKLRSHTELTSKSPVKQRVTAYQKKKPNCKWFIKGVEYGQLPVVDIAWTGFPNGSPSIDEGPKEAIGFEIVKLGMGGGIAPGTTLDFYMPLQGKSPKVSGFAKQIIPGFGPGQNINLSPLISKGAAWMEQSFKTEGKATISFLSKASDKGDVQILLGNNISLDYTWKIIIGGGRNTRSQIIKREIKNGKTEDVVVAEVSKEQNPLAAITTGIFVPYWVSVDDGSILVGVSTTPGENILMAWRDPNPRTKVSRVGFGTHDANVEYTGVSMSSPVTTHEPESIYTTESGTASASSNPTWLKSTFRVPGRGTMAFEVKAGESANILLSEQADKDADHYKLTLTKNENDPAILSKWDKGEYIELTKSQNQYNKENSLSEKEFKKFWISMAKGRIFVGQGELGENLFLYHWDLKPFEKILHCAIGSEKGGAQFKDITIAPPISVSAKTEKESYKDEKDRFQFKGSLHVISPYEYLLTQEGQSVKFEDKINKKTYYPGKTPQQNAKYYFMLMLQKDGFPQLEWVREPENPQKLALEKAAFISRAEGDAWLQASTYVQGMGALGGLAGVAASIAWGLKGQKLMASAGKKEAGAQFEFRSHDSYAFTDQAMQSQLARSSVPEEARANKAKATEKIELGGKWTPSTLDKLERLIPLYQQVINLINHPYVVRDQYIKKSLFDAMGTLYEAHQTLHADPRTPVDLTYSGLINLFISAYNNAYLIDESNKKEVKIKEVWYSQFNELTRQLLAKDPETKLSLKPCYGEYVWLNEQFEEPGKGSISFEAKGNNDLFIAFSSIPFKVRNTDTSIYETVIGGWDNSKTVIRIRSLDKSVAETESPDTLVNPIKFQRYWVSVNNGKVVVGKDDLDEKNKVFEWTDPYPIKDVAYVGISNWNAPAEFKNLQIGPPVDGVEEYKQKLIAQIMALRKKREAKKPEPEPEEEVVVAEKETKEESEKFAETVIEDEPIEEIKEIEQPAPEVVSADTEAAVEPAEQPTPAQPEVEAAPVEEVTQPIEEEKPKVRKKVKKGRYWVWVEE
jgi:hypothetical protein